MGNKIKKKEKIDSVYQFVKEQKMNSNSRF